MNNEKIIAPGQEISERQISGQQASILEASTKTPEWRDFFDILAASTSSALLLDFDGTLAPFRLDPSKVRPWAGVTSVLDQIQQTGRTRIALVSGRPAQSVAAQLNLAQSPEVWGLHGAERLLPDGSIEFEKLPLRKQLHLKAAHKALEESGRLDYRLDHGLDHGPNYELDHRPDRLGIRLETKWNAVAVHWRGLTAGKAADAQTAIHNLLKPIAADGDLEMLVFDGGIELRAGRTKGDSVHLILSEMNPNAPAAYLGDDTTDEFAFRALNAETTANRGLSVLVRRQWRPTAAHLWIRPPAGLRAFFNDWLRAVQSS